MNSVIYWLIVNYDWLYRSEGKQFLEPVLSTSIAGIVINFGENESLELLDNEKVAFLPSQQLRELPLKITLTCTLTCI